MTVFIEDKYRWRRFHTNSLICWYVGSGKAVERVAAFLDDNPAASADELKRLLKENTGNCALILQQETRLIAAVDKIRSYPVFYAYDGTNFGISNSARRLKKEYRLTVVDDLSLLEFRMAGYVTGRETLYRNLYQLQAGEFLIWEEESRKLDRDRYYLFYSEITRGEKAEVLIEELDEITNSIFRRVIEESGGAPIWVPLSGGLDSRLVLCKLKQLGYDRLQAFSYGAKGNYEAKAAKEVAEKVGVPWEFVPVKMREARAFFSSGTRKKFWGFSDGLCSVPNMQDIHALEKLQRDGKLAAEVVVINGQSGDFISGGHLPEHFSVAEPAPALLVQRALEKHFSQDLELLSERTREALSDKILDLIGIDRQTPVDRQHLASLNELWEWQERQCKYVVNGQRIYDFYALRWQLPLWAGEYLEFWPQIPLDLKIRQKLYRSYLERYDFYGCFRNFNPQIWRWPGVSLMVVPVGRTIKWLFGSECSERFYAYARYFGHYRQFYSPYGIGEYLRKATKIRGSNALNIERWVKENLGEGRC